MYEVRLAFAVFGSASVGRAETKGFATRTNQVALINLIWPAVPSFSEAQEG